MNTQCVIDAIATAVNGLNFLVFVSIVITSVVLALVFRLKVTDSLESLDVLRSLLDVERGRI